ncbi:MAG: DUF3108 domain-containing protein [Candidatus Tectomicrobia bacterium]|uniref:DUF3108 domain-containing protein n=1 Tax=Tectimicrobiota bacterium TaxID=2528274 RepID=A0A933GLQ2_UNCTE|nr:DUF3108 domain-containing protein [Candidatus Tectomicrobia bacterium]
MSKIKHKPMLLLLLGILLLSLPLTAFSESSETSTHVDQSQHHSDTSQSLPFKTGESYFFVVTYLGLTVGKASLQVADEMDFDGKKAYHFISTAKTNRFFDFFYKVRNRIDSWWDATSHNSIYYKAYQEEVDEIRTKEIRFFPEKELVVYKRGDSQERLNLAKKVQDPLSAFYFLRTRDIHRNESPIIVETFDSRRLWQIQVSVIGKERIEVPAGTFETLVVQSVLDYDTFFKQKGEILIWLSEDEKKMPIKVKSKIKFGSLEAFLERYETK